MTLGIPPPLFSSKLGRKKTSGINRLFSSFLLKLSLEILYILHFIAIILNKKLLHNSFLKFKYRKRYISPEHTFIYLSNFG